MTNIEFDSFERALFGLNATIDWPGGCIVLEALKNDKINNIVILL